MPGPAPRVAALFWALLIAITPAAAAVATGLWPRSRYRRDDTSAGRGVESGDP
ncbi:hypothetical protein ABZZ20_19035 [Streptomyces sp. NPDC006430]|uniref:hypothetical protein n=1 Tax=Streptomyces sp. NPDC006430 TaxID=3154299 RepID=UPI0033B621B0